ncbi:hypothetical protein CASFOL_037084 [Castilleja foliolosa]|uniref:5'-3' DNA helicase ZGRF1-like N-terminal domain-containing protein n=1 Tax=Castilleja foliolosa TaxID=1961234 RepID=A0ABD3BQG0_9LAMI
MEDARRWRVTYTKHVHQKRKVYQDGFLEHQSSRHKVLLYDEWDKLLESRFVKKEDVIKSGETLTSGSYLVDIGDLCGGHKPTSTVNNLENKENISEKPDSLHRYGFQSKSTPVDRKPRFGKTTKGRPINLSPSAKLIRDFKKSEANRCISSPNCMDMTKITTTGRQVKLYDTNRRQLDGKFLKKDEIVCSGESLAFEGHLVEIGELEGDHKPVIDSTHQGKNCNTVGKSDMLNHPAKIPTNKKFSARKIPDNMSSGELTILSESSSKVENAKLSWRNPENEPKRSVHDILSFLRQPNMRKVVTVNNPLVDDCLELQSSDVHSDIKDHHIEEHVEDCSGSAQEELREKTSDYDCGLKAVKIEPIDVLVAAEKCPSSENDSGSCLGLGTTNSEGQKPIESATLTKLNENGEPEDPPEICAFEEITTETNAAATLSSGTLPKLSEDKGSNSRSQDAGSGISSVASNDYTSHQTLKMDFRSKAMEVDDFPSFDLGI